VHGRVRQVERELRRVLTDLEIEKQLAEAEAARQDVAADCLARYIDNLKYGYACFGDGEPPADQLEPEGERW